MCEYIIILKIESDEQRSPNEGYGIPAPYIQIDTLHDQ